jgi:hypothetical protein
VRVKRRNNGINTTRTQLLEREGEQHTHTQANTHTQCHAHTHTHIPLALVGEDCDFASWHAAELFNESRDFTVDETLVPFHDFNTEDVS